MFFKKKEIKEKDILLNVCALLIHAAKIDEDFTKPEEEIIKKTLKKLGLKEEKISETINHAKNLEENSNQILNFTKEVKNLSEKDKIKIIEALWSIIYSNNDADLYETNLMRRLAGLLYIDNKTMGDIKERIKKEYS
tara:strand:- start:93 stop:503 length:411 start_codon:yes stop_codon:yes gene_type:complete